MIRLRVSTLNPKFEVEIETDDKDFKKVKKLLDHVIEKLGSNDSSTISVSPPSLPLSVPTDFSIKIDDGEKLNTHMDL